MSNNIAPLVYKSTSGDLNPCLTSKPNDTITLCESILPHPVLQTTFMSLVLSQAQVLRLYFPFYSQSSTGLSKRVLSYSKNQLFFLPENMVPSWNETSWEKMKKIWDSGVLVYFNFSKIKQFSKPKTLVLGESTWAFWSILNLAFVEAEPWVTIINILRREQPGISQIPQASLHVGWERSC